MKRIVVAPDSYKGALSARDVALAMARGLRAVDPQIEILPCPMADGGEGTLDAVAAARATEQREYEVTDANGAAKAVPWLLLKDEAEPSGLIEVAKVVGLPDARVAVAERGTMGVGQLIRHLLDQGMRRIYLGLGGTSTNDAGLGALIALGARFVTHQGGAVAPTLAGLASIAHADFRGLDARLDQVELVLLTDVVNPLCGPQGATAVFGPQKGIESADVTRWNAAIAWFAALCDARVGRADSLEPGSGAAGGLAYGLMLAGGRCDSGAKRIAELAGLPRLLKGADLVITGEGRSDRQTLMGKAPAIVAEYARAAGVPAVLVSGAVDAASVEALSRHFVGCHAVSDLSMPLAEAMAKTAMLVEQAMARVFRR